MNRVDLGSLGAGAIALLGAVVFLFQVSAFGSSLRELEGRVAKLDGGPGAGGTDAGKSKPAPVDPATAAADEAVARELRKLSAEIEKLRHHTDALVAASSAGNTGGGPSPQVRAQLREWVGEYLVEKDVKRRQAWADHCHEQMVMGADVNVDRLAPLYKWNPEQVKKVKEILGEQVKDYTQMALEEIQGPELMERLKQSDDAAAEKLKAVLDEKSFTKFKGQFRSWYQGMLQQSVKRDLTKRE